MKKPLVLLSLAVAAALMALTASTALAATKTWAATGSGSANWTTPANWVGGTAPVAGDDLIFPVSNGTLTTKTSNTYQPGTPFNSLTLNGSYSVTGNGFNLDGVNPTTALKVGAGQKAVIQTGAIFMHNTNANATSTISLGASSILDMHGSPQLTVGGVAGNVTNLVIDGGAKSLFNGPGSLDFDTLHLAGSTTLVPQLLSQNANTPGTVVTDPGTSISTALNAGANITSSSSITINGNLNEAVSAPSTGGLDFIGPVTFGGGSTVTWEAFNSNVDNVINFNQSVNLSPATFTIKLPPGFQPYAPNAVYPVITSQGAAFTTATEFGNMKEGATQTVGGYTFTGEYNVPDPGDFRVVVSGPPAAPPSPPATGHSSAPAPALPSLPAGVLFGLPGLLLVAGMAAYRRRHHRRL
jgi:hypothetical protein